MKLKMKNNIFLKLLSSLPVILIFLYFTPFVGVCLILLRYLMYNNKKKFFSTPIFFIVVGALIVVPKGFSSILTILNINTDIIPCLNDIISTEIYSINLIKYGKLLLTVGIIFLMIAIVFNSLFNKLESFLHSYIDAQEKRNAEISQKNDLIIKEKQEKAKNTQVVYCPYCGADNMLTSKIGTCKYCRRQIQAKD